MQIDHNTPEFQARLADYLADAPGLTFYVDPYPGLRGYGSVSEPCGYCGGTGIYHGRSGYKWVRDNVEDTYCFKCNGAGSHTVLVSSARARVRRQVKAANAFANEYVDNAEQVVENIMRKEAEEAAAKAAEEEAARKVEEQIAAMPEPGTKLQNVAATVERFATFEADSFSGYGTEIKAVLKLRGEDGRVYVWITTSGRAWDFEEGQAVRIERATVKRVSEYQGEAECSLTRPKLVEAEG